MGSASFDPTTRTLDAEVQLANDAGELRAGMFGRGAIVVGVHPNALVVPVEGVQISSGKRYAYVVRGDKAERRDVVTGVDGGDWQMAPEIADGEAVILGVTAETDVEAYAVNETSGVDTQTDKANCGTCGSQCSTLGVCLSGRCTACGPATPSKCNGLCVDTQVDPNNCGGCGQSSLATAGFVDRRDAGRRAKLPAH